MKTPSALFSAFALAVLVTPCAGQSVPRDLQTAMQQRRLATSRADVATWDRLTSNDFTLVTAYGRLMTKAQRLAQLRTEQPDTSTPKFEQETVQVHANAAIQRYRVGGAWVTLTWNKEAGGWRVGSAQVTLAMPDSAAVRRAIDDNNARFLAALKQGDAATAAANYTSDAVVMFPNSPAWQGAEAIRTGFGGFVAQFAVADGKAVTQDVIITPFYVIERGTYQWTLHPKSGGGADMTDNGKYLTVWELQDDGTWKISRDINNSDRAGSM
jgi:uncharacterized protein (TIGR02246 family)